MSSRVAGDVERLVGGGDGDGDGESTSSSSEESDSESEFASDPHHHHHHHHTDIYSDPNIVEESEVKLFTTSTKSNHITTGHELRTMHLLNTKNVRYQLVFLDLDRARQAEMEAVSHTTALPQLHIAATYYGDFPKLQEMEDKGELDTVLSRAGVEFTKRRKHAPGAGGEHTVTAHDGVLTAHATRSVIRLEWGEAVGLFDGDQDVDWLLLMDAAPVYVGKHTEFLVSHPGPFSHQFILRAVDASGHNVAPRRPVAAPPPSPSPSPAAPLSPTSRHARQGALGEVCVGCVLRDGLLEASANPRFVQFRWKEAAGMLNGGNFALLMDDEAVYRGRETEYLITTPGQGNHVFALRLADHHGTDITEQLPVRLGRLTIPIPSEHLGEEKGAAPGDARAEEHNKHLSQLQAMDEELARLSQLLDQEKQDKAALEDALAIVPTPSASLSSRNRVMLHRVQEMASLQKQSSLQGEDNDSVEALRQDVEKLHQQNFSLLGIELKSRDTVIAAQAQEIQHLETQLRRGEATLHRLQQRLGLPGDVPTRQLHDAIFQLQKERAQFGERLESARTEHEALLKIRGVMEDALNQMDGEVEEKSEERDGARERAGRLKAECSHLRDKASVFEESHVELMRQIESVTTALYEKGASDHGPLGKALHRLKQTLLFQSRRTPNGVSSKLL